MAIKNKIEAQNPLILRCHRLMEAFSKSDDERDFYLDRQEGFIIYVDLDKSQADIASLEEELTKNSTRYCPIPKLTFYETKKIMEGFINEKVYDIDTKEKLLDIIQSKDARENFLEFIYDHLTELEKWQQFYQERSRIRIIEWLRNNHYHFVFEEDLDMVKGLLEKVKRSLFQEKAPKEILTARKALIAKAKTYYSNEALNPRPKRGRPPKQAAKQEIEPKVSTDIYTTVPAAATQFLFIPDYSNAASITFSSKFKTDDKLANRKASNSELDINLESISQKLATLRNLSTRWTETDNEPRPSTKAKIHAPSANDFDFDEESEEDDLDDDSLDSDEPKSKNKAKAKPKKEPKRSIINPAFSKNAINGKKAGGKASLANTKTATKIKSKLPKSPAKPAPKSAAKPKDKPAVTKTPPKLVKGKMPMRKIKPKSNNRK
jgi:Uncharacterised protein family (UPF0158)